MFVRSLVLTAFVPFALTTPTLTSTLSPSPTCAEVQDPACTNGPFTRQCWRDGFSVATDYDATWPVTGETVSYDLEITNTTLSPDGYSRPVMVINGQYPGPTISANWGDTLSITVKNSLENNGTSIHWHGIRQLNSCDMDGVNGITECPLAPGQSKTYSFLCTQYGTSWYHSHFSAQYGDGVLGSIVINGPATANYDVDLGALPVTDWYYQSAFQEAEIAASAGPPAADNGLINGTMLHPSGIGGAYNTVTIMKGKKYRVRLINTSMDNHFKISLDGHNLTVIQADFVPIIPYSTQWLFIGIGQRYDVIITADQEISSYWFHADVQKPCGNNKNNFNIKAIFQYAGAASCNPTTNATEYTQSCKDENTLVPYVQKDVPASEFVNNFQEMDVNLHPSSVLGQAGNIVTWTVNGTSLEVDWAKPTLNYIHESNNSFPVPMHLIKLPNANDYYFWIIQSIGSVKVPHPIHLHGHDFYVLGAGQGPWTNDLASTLQYKNPPRRDVAMLPAQVGGAGGGWLAIAFLTDNPGAWLMHCHIAWHVGEGLAVQFLERESEIESAMDLSSLVETCEAWENYVPDAIYAKEDSGL